MDSEGVASKVGEAEGTTEPGSRAFLTSLLNSNLRLYTSDGRMFAGEFKCADNECNIILARAYEYRQPLRTAVAAAASTAAAQDSIRVDMTSRFMGLIVVPGQHITKIEVDA